LSRTQQKSREQRGFGTAAARAKSSHEPNSHLQLYKLQVAPLRAIGRLQDAEPILNLLLQSRTTLPEVYRDLSELAQAHGDSDQAERWRDTWLDQASRRPEARWEQGRAAEDLGRHQHALEHYQHLLKLQPRHLGALQHSSRLLLRAGAHEQALAMVSRWVDQSPDDLEGRVTLAACLLENQRPAEAEEQLKTLEGALVEPPWLSLGEAVRARLHQQQGDEAKALQLALQRLDPRNRSTNHWMVQRLLALLLLEQQRLDLLHDVMEQAIQLQPNQANLHGMQAEYLLLLGDLQAGYAAFDHRDRLLADRGNLFNHGCNLPRWEATSDQGPLVLVGAGTLGDTLLLSRYGPWLQERLQRPVQLFVPPPLMALLQDALGDQVSIHGFRTLHQQREGAALSLTSLPGLFGSCIEHEALRIPHLKAKPKVMEHWRERLKLNAGEILIGVNWHGSALQALSERHSSDIPLTTLEPLSQIPGVRLLSLQKGIGQEQLDECGFRDCFVNVQDEINREQRLEHVAALMSLCRYVVTDDSGPAHLAGCLGVAGVVLLPQRINWRWGTHLQGQSPWYPSLTLMRQGAGECWSNQVEKACKWLKTQLNPQQCDGGSKMGPCVG
jgi:tetratricopeptide (TPR) repeat protein